MPFKKKNDKKSNKKTDKEVRKKDSLENEISGIILISVSILVVLSLYNEATGFLGQIVRNTILSLFGFYGFIIPYVIIGTSILYMIMRFDLTRKLKFIVLINLSIITMIHIIYLNNQGLKLVEALKSAVEFGKTGVGGGIVGGTLSFISLTLLGLIGTYILIIAIILISILVLTDQSLFELLRGLGYRLNVFLKETIVLFKDIISKQDFKTVEVTKEKKKYNDPKDSKEIIGKEKSKKPSFIDKALNRESDEKIDKEIVDLKILDYNKNSNTSTNTMDNEENMDKKKKQEMEDYALPLGSSLYEHYEYPPIKILKEMEKKSTDTERIEVRKNADKLIETLENFGIEAKVSQVSIGPSITQYEVQPAAGIKVSRIVSLSNDIALSLASSDLRIEAPIPGKSAIGIEIPNKEKMGVSLREIIESKEFDAAETKLPMALGKDISGTPIIADIEKMPHLLIAGATGSGKSVCINTLIASIIYRAKPNEVKLLMIDPKMVELSVYNGIPHLLIPVVTEPKKAANALNWAVTEMNNRYKKFADAGVRDMKGFNKKVEDENGKMPQIVIIIDELADLMMVAASAVEDYICRLAQMARAAGIHLIVATQRPSVDIITGTIKANIPSRISFAVSSQVDSRTILDTGGAEKLLGKGDMLFLPVGVSKPIRIQGAFIGEDEVEEIVEFLKQTSQPLYEENIIEEIEKQVEALDGEDVDELFDQAVDLILQEGQASISLLQRKLKIGYARAARIVDEMEQRGVVGGHEGSKPRKILMTREELEN